MSRDTEGRGKMLPMARTRRNPSIPQLPGRSMDVVKTFRMPVELAERMDEARGLIPESVWLRERVEQYLRNREEMDLIELRDLMHKRGIQLRSFVEFCEKGEKT